MTVLVNNVNFVLEYNFTQDIMNYLTDMDVEMSLTFWNRFIVRDNIDFRSHYTLGL